MSEMSDDAMSDLSDYETESDEEEEILQDLHKVEDEHSPLSQEQLEAYERHYNALISVYPGLEEIHDNKQVLRLREQLVHAHGPLGGDLRVDAVVVLKAIQMLNQGLRVCVLNLNFLKRVQTRAMYYFLRDHMMEQTERLRNMRHMVYFKVQVEEPDDKDIEKLKGELQDIAEDAPLFVITDETCKEAERIDDSIRPLTFENYRFHFWTTSRYAHGTPFSSERRRLALKEACPPAIQQVMDMIDIDEDESHILGCHKPPVRQVAPPFYRENLTIRQYLDKLKVHLISHAKTKEHLSRDVWQCKACGVSVADYLNMVIELGEPGLEKNQVFIVGSIGRFESSVSISGMQMSLLERGIDSNVLFCRRAVRIQDILKTMNKVVVSDNVSMRGVDKKIVIVLPSPRPKELQEQVEMEIKLKELNEQRQLEEKKRGNSFKDDGSKFEKPKKKGNEDEVVLYLRPYRQSDLPDRISQYKPKKPIAGRKKYKEPVHKKFDDEFSDDETTSTTSPENLGYQDFPKLRTEITPDDLLFGHTTNQSVLRRTMNSMSKADKDMVLDIFTDAPRHAVMFHFAEDEYHVDPLIMREKFAHGWYSEHRFGRLWDM